MTEDKFILAYVANDRFVAHCAFARTVLSLNRIHKQKK